MGEYAWSEILTDVPAPRVCQFLGEPNRHRGSGWPLSPATPPGLGVQELRELRSLREENGRLKRIVSDLTLTGR